MPHGNRILALIAASFFAYLVWAVSGLGLAMLAAVGCLGVCLAQLYWPGFLARTPHWLYRAKLLALSLPCAYILIGALDAGGKVPMLAASHGRAVADTTQMLLIMVACLLMVFPLLRAGLRSKPNAEPVPLWPIVAGLAGGGAICLSGAFLWTSFAGPVLELASLPRLAWITLPTIPDLALSGLVAGAGGAIWLHALEGPFAGRRDSLSIFPSAVTTSAVATSLGVVITLAATFYMLHDTAGLAFNGTFWCGLGLAGLGMAWVVTLIRLSRLAPAGPFHVAVAVVMLTVLCGLTFAIPFMLVSAQEWTPIVMVVVAPLTLGATVLVLAAVPFLIGAILAFKARRSLAV